MKELLSKIKSIPISVHLQIEERIDEFQSVRGLGKERLFLELCFCFLTANYDAAKSIRIHDAIGRGFIELGEDELALKLRTLGYRFPNMRARYAVEARRHFEYLNEKIYPYDNNITYEDEHSIRMWIDANIKGIGYKEASHFMRNVGYKELAIVDFHIMDILVEHNIIPQYKSRSLTRTKYVEIEKMLREIGREASMDMARLDYCLWYIETGKVLK
jgi:N-glycosylase/DNA lyase